MVLQYIILLAVQCFCTSVFCPDLSHSFSQVPDGSLFHGYSHYPCKILKTNYCLFVFQLSAYLHCIALLGDII